MQQEVSLTMEGNATLAKEAWNRPKHNIARMGVVFLTFFNLGLQGSCRGPLLPYLEQYYQLGYILAAISSDRMHTRFGRRGLAIFASSLRVLVCIALVLHPPWPAIIVIFIFSGWGSGLLDAGWNTWVSALNRPNELLGLIHAFFGLGGAMGPVIASAIVDTYGLQWYQFYYVPLGLSLFELVSGVWAFWAETGPEYRIDNIRSGERSGRTRASLKHRTTWTVATFALLYVGAEIALSGWVVTFMIRVRGAKPVDASLTSTGFWLGITVGRLVLGFITGKLGERWAIVGYLILGMALELMFWLVPTFVVSALAIGLLGFFLGPMFPALIIALSKLLPKHLHVGAVSFTAAVGAGGGALLPFGVGAIASVAGVQVLQPIILSVLGLLLLLWLTLPKIPKDGHLD